MNICKRHTRWDHRHGIQPASRFAGSNGTKFADLFAQGYQLLRQQRVSAALDVFRRLRESCANDRPLQLMIACCLASLGKLADSREVVASTLEGTAGTSAVDRLARAFAARAEGRVTEAANLFAETACLRSDLPTVALFLGDVLEQMTLSEEARYAWGLSIRRCRRAPHVARCARQRLCSVSESSASDDRARCALLIQGDIVK